MFVLYAVVLYVCALVLHVCALCCCVCLCCMFVLYAAVYVCVVCCCMCFYCRCVCPALIYCFVHFPIMFNVRCVLLSAYFIVCLLLSVNSFLLCVTVFSESTMLFFNLCLYVHFISVILGCLLNIWQGTTDEN